MTDRVYRYDGVVERVVDGDTIVVSLDLGFRLWLTGQTLRLAGCNARELSEPGGLEARDHVATLLPPGTRIAVTSVRLDKYGGRVDGQVTLPDGSDLAATLIADGWAAPWNGRGRKPEPPWPRAAPQAGLTNPQAGP